MKFASQHPQTQAHPRGPASDALDWLEPSDAARGDDLLDLPPEQWPPDLLLAAGAYRVAVELTVAGMHEAASIAERIADAHADGWDGEVPAQPAPRPRQGERALAGSWERLRPTSAGLPGSWERIA